jgi:hypothetical protein
LPRLLVIAESCTRRSPLNSPTAEPVDNPPTGHPPRGFALLT